MLNLRKQFLTRSSLLVYVSLCFSMLGRYGFDRGLFRHALMTAGATALTAAMVVLFLDMRNGNKECLAGR